MTTAYRLHGHGLCSAVIRRRLADATPERLRPSPSPPHPLKRPNCAPSWAPMATPDALEQQGG
jgi:hypothetical protein